MVNVYFVICEAEEEQSDQTSACDEEEATVTQVTHQHQPDLMAVGFQAAARPAFPSATVDE